MENTRKTLASYQSLPFNPPTPPPPTPPIPHPPPYHHHPPPRSRSFLRCTTVHIIIPHLLVALPTSTVVCRFAASVLVTSPCTRDDREKSADDAGGDGRELEQHEACSAAQQNGQAQPEVKGHEDHHETVAREEVEKVDKRVYRAQGPRG